MASEADHEAFASEFVGMTGTSAERATQYLSASNWNLESAVQAFYADIDEQDINQDAAGPSEAAPPDYTGPRTLDGRPAPQAIPTTSSRSAARKPPKKTGLATLSSIGGGHSHDHNDDDSEDDEDDAHRDTYAGGEKSGLAIQDPDQRPNPRQIVNDLLSKARSNAQRPETSEHAGPSSAASFRGSGQTLGGEGEPSRTIPDPRGPSRASLPPGTEVQERTLHLWRDGFSIDEGELRRFDDPENAEALRMIQQGRAPVHLMNVNYDEPLDVKLEQHEENYRPLPKKYRPFGGEGRRLGSPVPGELLVESSTASQTAPAPSTGAAATSSSSPSNAVDGSQPTVMIRIQMPDGTRLPARFNAGQTVDDVYDFITRASPDLRGSDWVLATTFPNKDHTDKSLVIGEMAEFKKGGTAVVKRNK